MNEKKVLQLYTDLGDKIKRLSREDKGALLEAMFAWANGEPLPDDMTLPAQVAWDFILPMLEAADTKYREVAEKRQSAAKKRWETVKGDASAMQTDASAMQTDASACNKEKDKEKDIKEKGDTNVSPKKKFARPTLTEVQSFVTEHGYTLDVQRFYDYYESNGWKVGRNPMKDWRAALRNWLKNDFDRGKGQSLPDDDLNAYMAAQAAKERAEDEARRV